MRCIHMNIFMNCRAHMYVQGQNESPALKPAVTAHLALALKSLLYYGRCPQNPGTW